MITCGWNVGDRIIPISWLTNELWYLTFSEQQHIRIDPTFVGNDWHQAKKSLREMEHYLYITTPMIKRPVSTAKIERWTFSELQDAWRSSAKAKLIDKPVNPSLLDQYSGPKCLHISHYAGEAEIACSKYQVRQM